MEQGGLAQHSHRQASFPQRISCGDPSKVFLQALKRSLGSYFAPQTLTSSLGTLLQAPQSNEVRQAAVYGLVFPKVLTGTNGMAFYVPNKDHLRRNPSTA